MTVYVPGACGSAVSPSPATRARSATAGSRRSCTRPATLDLSLHIEPCRPPLAADRLRRQRARLRVDAPARAERGRLPDPMRRRRRRRRRRAREPRSPAARAASSAPASTSPSAPQPEELDERTERREGALRLAASAPRPGNLPTVRGLALHAAARPRPAAACGATFDTRALAAVVPVRRRRPAARPGRLPLRPRRSRRPGPRSTASRRDNYNSVLLARQRRRQELPRQARSAAAALPTACRCSSSTPKTSTAASADAVGGVYLPLAGPDAVTLNPLDLPPERRIAGARTSGSSS